MPTFLVGTNATSVLKHLFRFEKLFLQSINVCWSGKSSTAEYEPVYRESTLVECWLVQHLDRERQNFPQVGQQWVNWEPT